MNKCTIVDIFPRFFFLTYFMRIEQSIEHVQVKHMTTDVLIYVQVRLWCLTLFPPQLQNIDVDVDIT